MLENFRQVRLVRVLLLHIPAVIVFGQSFHVNADWKDEVGYTKLANEVGPGLEDGTGVVVAISEAFVRRDIKGNEVESYLIDLDNGQFGGKNVVDASNLPSGLSGHATSVAGLFFGSTRSISGGITDVTLYEANDWLNRVTGLNSGADPAAQNFRIMNGSWAGSFSDTAAVINALQRTDFIVERDDVLVIAGTTNNENGAVPHLLASGYNSMIVGTTEEGHSHGFTQINGAGRIRPHIVAPASRSSDATPMVSSAAAILHQRAVGTDAVRNEVMRSVLMAGATKEEFADWDRTTTRPLDDEFGAGELNVYNSYKILEGGQYSGSEIAPTFSVGLSGWDYVNEIAEGDTLFYNFTVDERFAMDKLSIALNWNLNVTDLDDSPLAFEPSATLANLDMRFYDSTLGFQNSLLDASLSSVDNLEHIFLTGLTSGTYTLEIGALSGTTDFGLAWSGSLTAVPEPTTWGFLAAFSGLLMYRQRRKSITAT